MDLYDTWYEALSKKDSRDPETDAFYQRCHTTALRLAILRCVSQGDDLCVSEKQMAGAIALIEQQLPEVKRVTMWSGGSIFEVLRSKFLTLLQKSGGLTTRKLALRALGCASDEFDKICVTLVQSGLIEIPKTAIKGEVVIKITKEGTGARVD